MFCLCYAYYPGTQQPGSAIKTNYSDVGRAVASGVCVVHYSIIMTLFVTLMDGSRVGLLPMDIFIL